jgi:Family of unknown function (DUF6035)
MSEGFAPRNVTIAGLSPAQAVQKPEIEEIMDLDDATYLRSVDFIESHQHQHLVITRNDVLARLRDGKPRFCCARCSTPVYLVATTEKRFFFRHRVEDGSCPAQTRHPLTQAQICERKYHGLRESAPHKRIKELIERSLRADTTYRAIAQEKTWRSIHDPAAYRRPDVQADSDQGMLAFEVQLSTTFLSVVVGRRLFYRDEGALLIWVFGSFDPEYRRLMTDDVLFPNNSNLFVVDEETAAISEANGVFHLRCHYRLPVRDGAMLADKWQVEIVPFASVTQDREGQRAYYYDYEGKEAALKERIRFEAEQTKAEIERIDRADFFEFWQEHGRSFTHTEANCASWQHLRQRIMRRGIQIPEWPDNDSELRAMVSALYSVREGYPIGWNYSKLIQVGHLLAESHPRQLVAFGHALNIHDRAKQVSEEDNKGKWAERMKPVSVAMRRRDPTYQPDANLLPLMAFLFPEVAAKVQAYLDRRLTA